MRRRVKLGAMRRGPYVYYRVALPRWVARELSLKHGARLRAWYDERRGALALSPEAGGAAKVAEEGVGGGRTVFRVTLPRELVELLGWREGHPLFVELSGGTVFLASEARTERERELREGLLKFEWEWRLKHSVKLLSLAYGTLMRVLDVERLFAPTFVSEELPVPKELSKYLADDAAPASEGELARRAYDASLRAEKFEGWTGKLAQHMLSYEKVREGLAAMRSALGAALERLGGALASLPRDPLSGLDFDFHGFHSLLAESEERALAMMLSCGLTPEVEHFDYAAERVLSLEFARRGAAWREEAKGRLEALYGYEKKGRKLLAELEREEVRRKFGDWLLGEVYPALKHLFRFRDAYFDIFEEVERAAKCVLRSQIPLRGYCDECREVRGFVESL